jgi:hypothetical protein
MKFAAPAAIALLLSLAGSPAFATLGGDPTSVELDRSHMKGAVRVKAGAAGSSYSVHEITTATGMTVREYVSADGKVFGFSWHGNTLPDLRQLLGPYYDQFAQAARGPHYNHHYLGVELPGLKVYSGARSRAYYGRAWDPSLIPQNVSTDEIK